MQKGSRSEKNPNQNLCHGRFVSWSLRPGQPGWPLSPYGRYARDSALMQNKGLAPPRSLWHHMHVPHSHPRVTTQQPPGVTQAAADANVLGWGVDASPATQQRTCQGGRPGSHCPGVRKNSGPVPRSPPARETKWDTGGVCKHSQGAQGNTHILPWRAYGLH